jgi:hypothetical protein
MVAIRGINLQKICRRQISRLMAPKPLLNLGIDSLSIGCGSL